MKFIYKNSWIVKLLSFLVISLILSLFPDTNSFWFYFISYMMIEIIFNEFVNPYFEKKKNFLEKAPLYTRLLGQTIEATDLLIGHLIEFIERLQEKETNNTTVYHPDCTAERKDCLLCKISSIKNICNYIRTDYENYKNHLNGTLLEDFNNEVIKTLMDHLEAPNKTNIIYLKEVIVAHHEAMKKELEKFQNFN